MPDLLSAFAVAFLALTGCLLVGAAWALLFEALDWLIDYIARE